MKKKLLVFSFLVIVLGCNDSKRKEAKEGNNRNKKNDKQNFLTNKNVKLYSIPAPLQVATAIKSFNCNYTQKLLLPVDESITNNGTNNFVKALNTGVLSVDMGYATLYEQKQTSIYYLSRLQKLTDELGLQNAFESSIVKRFKNNAQNQDSLYYIILDSFNSIQKFLLANDREETGILISTGSFIEGLYLAVSHSKTNKQEHLLNLIAQQQMFLDNILSLLGEYKSQKEFAGLIKELEELKQAYKGIEITYPDSEFNNYNTVSNTPINNTQLNAIAEKIIAIRNKITS
jgi:hypothetical protein